MKKLLKTSLRSTKVKGAVFVLGFAVIGSILLFATRAATPFASLEPEQGTKTANATIGSDTAASGGQYVQFGTDQINSTAYPARGSVGFLGNASSLTVITPAGGYYEVTGNNPTLTNVYVKGCVFFNGTGTLTVRNSIIEGGWGAYCVLQGGANNTTIDVADSTIRWRAGTTPDAGAGNGAIGVSATVKIIANRNDVSGTPDGIQTAGSDSVISNNWIHNLAWVGTYPNNTHNDGVQIFSGTNLTISNNRIETGAQSPYSNSALFFQCDCGTALVENNFLDGGGYTLYMQNGTLTVRGNVFGPNHLFGTHVNENNGATITSWLDNNLGDANGVKYVPNQPVNQ